jgi:2,3-bisphosphoglycerate-independent phosphoglycerate mutase
MTEKKENYFPFVLIILDGFGIAPSGPGNAVKLSKIPNLDRYFSSYPYTELTAHGKAVGLFEGEDGNSEAGHINIGAGRIVKQDLVAVTDMINDGTFFKNTAFKEAMDHVKKHKSNLHLIGLLTGSNSAHAHPDHLDALIEMARAEKIEHVYLHLFTDGRDSPPSEGYNFLHELLKKLDPSREQVATIMGRFYGMDRKKEWGRTELAYDTLTKGGRKMSADPLRAIEDAYARGETDEYIKPTIITDAKGKAMPRIDSKDSVIFFNARSDRARQLTKAFVQPDFNEVNPGRAFKRRKKPKDIVFVALTDFGPDLPNILTAYPSPDLKNTLPMELRELRQIYIAETDKYGHMTYFFNGGYADPVGGEERVLVKSPDVKSYDLSPGMAAEDSANLVVKNTEIKAYDFFAVNFANPDMVGHTGNLTATIKGIEITDKCVKKIIDTVVDKNHGTVIITADHGNAEEMIDSKTGNLDTEHSFYPVPFCIVGPRDKVENMKLKSGGVLADVAPTILYLLKKDKPTEMTGQNLIKT